MKHFVIFIAVMMILSACAPVSPSPDDPPEPSPSASDSPSPSHEQQPSSEPSVPPEPSPEPSPEPAAPPRELFHPYYIEDTDPAKYKYARHIQVNGETVSEYLNTEHILFTRPEDYAALPGVTTFRGSNFRNQPAWGSADVKEETLTELYRINVGILGRWTGVGWSGQPAVVQWDYDVQQQMNLLPEKKDKAGLIEVIQGALDGYVYFFDLEDGEPTRERIHFGEPIKGGISIDPRGFPLLYIGQGDLVAGSRFGYYIYSLIDGKELYFINGRDRFAHRTWAAFDSNPIFDIPNDRFYLWGENGVLYSVKLNTNFDRAAGTISIDPDVVRHRNTSTITNEQGVEGSVAAFGHYLFASDNSGIVYCIDLTTMQAVWMRDTTENCDSTVVLDWEEENGMLALYTGCSVKWRDAGSPAYLRKLNAENGELLWERSYNCNKDPGIPGGLMSTPISGRGDMEDYVFFWVGKLTNAYKGRGVLVCLDKQTGETVWENFMPHYGYSSPADIYTEDGTGYIVVADSAGLMYLIRGTTGEVLDTISVGSNVEASPAVWGNKLVVGTRGQRIFGIEIN